jgi:ParB family chromosome partitioning protein
MTLHLKKVLTDKCDYPSQPRSNPDLEYCRRLGASMKAIGQQVPVIGYTDPASGRFILGDGGCRLIGAREAGIAELLALDLGTKPTLQELLLAQAAIDLHKQHLKPIDRARLWDATKKARNCTARQLANDLGVDESLVGDYLSLLKLPPDVQEQVNSGALHMSKACLIAQQESNPDRQRELATEATSVSRHELAARLRKNRRNAQPAPAVRLARVKIAMPHGAMVVITGKELGMSEVVELLAETLKEARKAAEQYDVKTFQSMMRDKARG